MEIKQISHEQTHPLRHQVLRPHQKLTEMSYPGDDASGSAHFGAFDGDELLAIASIYPEDQKGEHNPRLWRLRGMAVDPKAQGKGLGQLIIQALLKHCKEQEAQTLWCNARIKALGFYEKLGFKRTGELFEIEGIGLHSIAEIEI